MGGFPYANSHRSPGVSRRIPCKCKYKNNSDYRLSNVEKITSTILPLASNILYTPLPFRLFSNLFSVTMLALLLRISSKIAQKCRCKIAELILSTLLSHYFSDFQRRKNPLPHALSGNIRTLLQSQSESLPEFLALAFTSSWLKKT